ncbi:trypsin-like peptidase domain-containing protein [Candidatus Uhrbacteria bacterium]|nr:trypsin-like peptidase domain-containing protein [Candidatus Uhrbacteria bacterium]
MKKIVLNGLSLIALSGFFLNPAAALAAERPFPVHQAVAQVRCGNRQGSGVVVNAEKGYVLTNAHILLNLNTLIPDACDVGFMNDLTLKPTIFYEAKFDRYVFDEEHNKDFAVLKIGKAKQAQKLPSFPFLKTDEFSAVGDPLAILAFPSSNKGTQLATEGTIKGLESGIVKTDAVISPGASGGAGLDAANNLIGIATRILLRQVDGVEEVVDYELVDIRAILTWLDTFGENVHDLYTTHADFDRYHVPTAFFQAGNLSCVLLAKIADTSTVYCLHADGTRSVFPNDATYHSWFGDFSGVLTVPVEQLAAYRLVSNVTMKPGTLVKIQTDPKVYLVSDVLGTLRWIENEDRAKELYGEGWAGFVKDVPDTFFINYRLGSPVQ